MSLHAGSGASFEVMAITDLSDVSAKTGSGSTVVFQTNPTIDGPIIQTGITLDAAAADYTLTWANPGGARAISIPDPGGTDSFAFLAATQALTNKTYNGLTVTASTGVLTVSNGKTLTISSTIRFIGAADGNAFTFPSGDDTVVTLAASQTLTSKTLTAPDINAGTADSLTSLSIRSTGAAFDLTLATATVFSAGRTLTIDPGDAARTITLSGNPTLADWFDQAVKVASNPTFGNLTITSFAANWTNAGRTVADLGTITTADINGGTLDGTVIGGASAAAITGTTITVNTGLVPDANDGAYLGVSNTGEFSDLFLASGAVIGWANADVSLTHSSNLLAITGGDLVIGGSALSNAADILFADSNTNSGRRIFCRNQSAGNNAEAAVSMASDTATGEIEVFSSTHSSNPNVWRLRGTATASVRIESPANTPTTFYFGGSEVARFVNETTNGPALLVGRTSKSQVHTSAEFEYNRAGASGIRVYNSTSGTSAFTYAQVASDSPGIYVQALSSTYTTSGIDVQGDVTLRVNGCATAFDIGNADAKPIYFWTNNTNEMALLSGGGLIINGTAKVGSEELRVNGDAWIDGVFQLEMGTSAAAANAIGRATSNTTAVGNVGTGEDDLMTYSFPANSLTTTGRGVRITAWGTFANNANAKTLKSYFGATILTNSLTANVAGNWHIEALVFRTGSNAQDYVAKLVTTGAAGVAVVDTEIGTLTQTESGAITIKCTGEATTDNDIVQEGMLVEFIN